jgi:Amt family ammonium transporter
VIGLAIKHTIGWRVTADDEVDGIDAAEHGESAYDLDGRSGGVRTPLAAGHATTSGKTRAPEGVLA